MPKNPSERQQGQENRYSKPGGFMKMYFARTEYTFTFLENVLDEVMQLVSFKIYSCWGR